MIKRISACRLCGGNQLDEIIDLGVLPLANALLDAQSLTSPEFKAPLAVVLCQNCSLAQITHTVPPEELFSDYNYFSSFSDSMLAHSEAIANKMVETLDLTETDLVVEIASNDGYLLQYYKAAGVPVLGIEPAKNIAAIAQQRGIETLCEFFNEDLASRLAENGSRADVIHANNVFAHVPDINSFLKGIYSLLNADATAVIEFPYVGQLVSKLEFDTIYHEHVFYFSLTSAQNACRRNGLTVVSVEQLPIHGGSLRIYVKRQGEPDQSVVDLLQQELHSRLHAIDGYRGFAQRVTNLKQDLSALLHSLKANGKKIAAYGAAAKGATLLNFFGLGSDVIEFVVDRSAVKQNHFMPGIHLPILEPAKLLEKQPDYVLLLTWNFAEEILQQQAEYLSRGGAFIVPVPKPEIVTAPPMLLAADA